MEICAGTLPQWWDGQRDKKNLDWICNVKERMLDEWSATNFFVVQ